MSDSFILLHIYKMKKTALLTLGFLSLLIISVAYADDVTKPVCTNTWAICLLRQQMQSEITTAKADLQSQTQTLKDQVQTNKWLIEANKKNFNANFSGAKSYLTKPLTGDTKFLIDDIIKAKDTAMQALQVATNALAKSWTVDRDAYITQATSIITTFRDALLPYVASEKSAMFDSFIQWKINSMISNVSIRQTNTNIKMQIWEKQTTFKTWLNAKKAEFKNTVQTMKAGKK